MGSFAISEDSKCHYRVVMCSICMTAADLYSESTFMWLQVLRA